MRAFWDARYDTDQFIYGKAPNEFFASELDKLDPGKIILPGEGEGRNAVYAATRGWMVDAFDQSQVAAQKAMKYARSCGVRINYRVCESGSFPFPENHYDVVGMIYFHLPPDERAWLHSKVIRSLKPGGILILEAFHVSQLGNDSGGPQSTEMLLDTHIVKDDFGSLHRLFLKQLSIPLNEGTFHQGEAEVIRFIGKKTH